MDHPHVCSRTRKWPHFFGAPDGPGRHKQFKCIVARPGIRRASFPQKSPKKYLALKDVRETTNQPPALSTDFKLVAKDNADGWTVFATMITCEGDCYERYVFTIYKYPGKGFQFSEPVLIRLIGYKL